ncbi:MAG: response regulator [Anaerolineae bacterium]|nr:response regulator [Anaerolineae bacterium]
MAGERILVTDDGRENREFIQEYILEPNGYQALLARDGLEGLQMAVEQRPDLILLDLQMPRMDGIQVLQNLASRNLDIPVILMTFHGSEEIAIEVYRLGVRDYLKKPFTVEEMLDSIERSLSEVRLRREKEALTERVLAANRELQQRVQEMNVLYSVGKSVTATLNMDEILPRIVDAAAQITQAEAGYIYLVKGERLVCRAMKRAGESGARPVNLEAKDPVANQVIQTSRAVVLTPEQLGNHQGSPVSLAYVPVLFQDVVTGVLGVTNHSPSSHVFSKHDRGLLSTLTDYASVAIENSRNYEELRRTKEHEKAQLRGSFERLVPPSIVDQILAHPESLELGGRRQEISILFADIRGYTAWSENEPPEKVVEMLNDYLSLAAEIILAWNGTLDKFFGDGLMAIFNAPDEQEDHVHRAADAALALLRAAKDMHERGGYNLSYSVGVNVGEAVVGYIGTERAMNYTAIGDTVNLAKRLQEYGSPGQVLVEEAVIKRLGNLAQHRPLGELKVKGRKQPAFAYELLGLRPIV